MPALRTDCRSAVDQMPVGIRLYLSNTNVNLTAIITPSEKKSDQNAAAGYLLIASLKDRLCSFSAAMLASELCSADDAMTAGPSFSPESAFNVLSDGSMSAGP